MGPQLFFNSDTRPPLSHGMFIPIAVGLIEEFSPLLAALPLSLFAFYLSRAAGQERFEFANPEVAQEHYGTIHRVTQGGTSMSNNAQVDEGKVASRATHEVA